VPELPEVETYARDLARVLPGRVFRGAVVTWPNQLPANEPAEFARRIAAQRVAGVSRRGKYLLLALPRDTLVVHLKMSGRLILAAAAEPPDRHAHVVLALDGGDELRFRDPRKFGRVYLLERTEALLGPLGPEPLEPAFTAAALARRLAGRRARLKPLLLDQRFVAGLGNIYADESLWAAGLHPLRVAGTLSAGEAATLQRSIRHVLERAVAARGSSLSDGGYRDLTGNPGEMQGSLAVYGRSGAPCPRCGTAVRRLLVAGRGTHLCPRCQPAPP